MTVSFAQREVLSLLQLIKPADAPTCSALLVTLAEMSTFVELAGVNSPTGSSSHAQLTVSKEFRALALQSLTTLLVSGFTSEDASAETSATRIPAAAKVQAFVGMTSGAGNICLHHLQIRSRWLAARESFGPKQIVRSASTASMVPNIQIIQSSKPQTPASPSSRVANERQGVMGVLSSVMDWWYAPPSNIQALIDKDTTAESALEVHAVEVIAASSPSAGKIA